MKLLVALPLLAVISAASATNYVLPVHDGRPGCRVRYEFNRLWRNHFNNAHFWRCDRWEVPATSVPCPPATRFQDSWQTCLQAQNWVWTPYFDPPTRPGTGPVNECEELEIDNECDVVCPPVTTESPPPVSSPETTVSTNAPSTVDPCPCNPSTTPPSTTAAPCDCETTPVTPTTPPTPSPTTQVPLSPTTPTLNQPTTGAETSLSTQAPTTSFTVPATTPSPTQPSTTPYTPPPTSQPPTTPSTEPPTTPDPCPCSTTTTAAPGTTTPPPCPCLTPDTTPETTEWTTIGTIPLESSTQEATTQAPGPQCAGATPEQHTYPGTHSCLDTPNGSDCTFLHFGRRLPTRNPTVFFECMGNLGWVRRTCSMNLCFSGSLSQCVTPRIWNNSCSA